MISDLTLFVFTLACMALAAAAGRYNYLDRLARKQAFENAHITCPNCKTHIKTCFSDENEMLPS